MQIQIPRVPMSLRKILVGLMLAMLGAQACLGQSAPVKLVVLQPLERPNIQAVKLTLDAAFAHAGIRYTLEHNPPERALAAFRDGAFDGDASRLDTFPLLVPEAIRVEPHIQNTVFFAIGPGTASKPASWVGLSRFSIAYVRGYRGIEMRTIDVAVREVTDSEEACLRMALARRVDWCVLAAERRSGWPFQAQYGDRMTAYPIDSLKVYVWMGPKRKDVADRLTKALRDMDRTGELQKIMGPFRRAD
jgi:hypothetical protein